jgi:hypothetical protein
MRISEMPSPKGATSPGIAQAQALNSTQDLSLAHIIPQVGEPFGEFGRLLDRYHVAYKLQSDTGDFKMLAGIFWERIL